jgi:MinD superfamily P-loop ATPase
MERWLDLTESALRAAQPGLPEFDPARCLPARHSSGRCAACYEVCPHEALGPGPVPRPDPGACDGCSACVAVCPTGALKSAGIAAALEHWLTAIAAGSVARANVAAIIACERRVAAMPTGRPKEVEPAVRLEVPCIGSVRAADIVAAVASGAGTISLLTGECATCDRAPAGTAAPRAATAARATLEIIAVSADVRWCEETDTRPAAPGRDRERGARAMDPPSGSPADQGRAVTISRRGLFGYWRRTARRAVSEVARETEATTVRVARQGAAPLWRRRLESDIAGFAANAAAPDQLGGTSAALPAGGALPLELGIGRPVLEGSCDGCGLCALVCPLGALSVGRGSVACRPGACTACGLCEEICPTHGLIIRELDSRHAMPVAVSPRGWSELAGAVSEPVLADRAVAADRGMRDFALRPGPRSRTVQG